MTLAYASIGFAAAFLLLLFALHFLEPEFSPLWRMISEYEIGHFGWMMRLAFFCWGAAVLCLLLVLWPALIGTAGGIGRIWLAVIVVALAGAGIFKTDPITDITNSRTNTLHTLSGVIVIMTFPIAATLAARGLLHNAAWQPYHGWLVGGTVLVWFGMVAYFASIIISRAIHPGGGRSGPHIYQGWPNRFLVVVYIFWIMIAAFSALAIGV